MDEADVNEINLTDNDARTVKLEHIKELMLDITYKQL
mgnify:CR=1 FL=1